MMKPVALACGAILVLGGCAQNINQPMQAAVVDTAKMPQTGIFTVKDAVVSDQGQDTVRVAAAATNKFTFAELSSVVLCRARDEAVSRKYDGWYQDGIQQVSYEGGQQAIATVHFFKGKAPEGKKTLKQEKNPCREVPGAAKVKA